MCFVLQVNFRMKKMQKEYRNKIVEITANSDYFGRGGYLVPFVWDSHGLSYSSKYNCNKSRWI